MPERGPVVFDMGTAAFMTTELMLRERRGESLPPGVALDADGAPTTDPASARQGALLPFGGHKGFGLALMVQALGVLAGSALDLEGDNGYLFIVFKPDLLTPLDQFKREMTALIDRLEFHGRFVGFDVGEDITGLDTIAFLHVPFRELALFHCGR